MNEITLDRAIELLRSAYSVVDEPGKMVTVDQLENSFSEMLSREYTYHCEVCGEHEGDSIKSCSICRNESI